MAENRLKELRKASNMTLKELSEKLKEKGLTFNVSQLSSYEKGTMPRNKKIWEVLAELFNVSESYLAGMTDVKTNDDLRKLVLDNAELLRDSPAVFMKQIFGLDDENSLKWITENSKSFSENFIRQREFEETAEKVENAILKLNSELTFENKVKLLEYETALIKAQKYDAQKKKKNN